MSDMDRPTMACEEKETQRNSQDDVEDVSCHLSVRCSFTQCARVLKTPHKNNLVLRQNHKHPVMK